MASRERLEEIAGRAESLSFVGVYNVCELAEEVTRLWSIEAKALAGIAEKKKKHADLLEDAEECLDKGWDEGHERLQGEIRVCLAEIRVLEMLLG